MLTFGGTVAGVVVFCWTILNANALPAWAVGAIGGSAVTAFVLSAILLGHRYMRYQHSLRRVQIKVEFADNLRVRRAHKEIYDTRYTDILVKAAEPISIDDKGVAEWSINSPAGARRYVISWELKGDT